MPIAEKKSVSFAENTNNNKNQNNNTTLTLPPSISRQILQILNPGIEFDFNEKQEYRPLCQTCKSPLFHTSYYRNKQWTDILECRSCKKK